MFPFWAKQAGINLRQVSSSIVLDLNSVVQYFGSIVSARANLQYEQLIHGKWPHSQWT